MPHGSCSSLPGVNPYQKENYESVTVNYVSQSLRKGKMLSIKNLYSLGKIRWHGDQNYQ